MRRTPMKENQKQENFEIIVKRFDNYLYEIYDELNRDLQQSEKPIEAYEIALQKTLWNRIATSWSLIKQGANQ